MLRKGSSVVLVVMLAIVTLLGLFGLALADTNALAVNPGESIQAAIDAASPGDTIVINAGIYTESLTLGKAVSLTGVSSATTIIRALPDQRVLTVTGASIDSNVVISGLTFADGNVDNFAGCPSGCGGGVQVTDAAQPSLRSVRFSNNQAGAGGGLYVDAGSVLTLRDTTFIDNVAATVGGGLRVSDDDVIVIDSRFENNRTNLGHGGGLAADGALVDIRNTVFKNNHAKEHGGGAYADIDAVVENSYFENNTASWGGGLRAFGDLQLRHSDFISNSASMGGAVTAEGMFVSNSHFEGNHASTNGGALNAFYYAIVYTADFYNNTSVSLGGALYDDGALTLSQTTFISNAAGSDGGAVVRACACVVANNLIINSLFARNHAGGDGEAVYQVATAPDVMRISFSTFASDNVNPGTAIYVGSGKVAITNTIVTSHGVAIQNTGGTVGGDYNVYFGNTTNFVGTVGSGADDLSNADPLFVDPAADNYRLLDGSPAVDSALDLGVLIDLNGNVRPQGSGYDRGAYEGAVIVEEEGVFIYLPVIMR